MQSEKTIKFSGPADYKIIVQGRLTSEFLNFFNVLNIFPEENSENGNFITKLTVSVKDQAELAGLLNSLYEWRYLILLVECEHEILKSF